MAGRDPRLAPFPRHGREHPERTDCGGGENGDDDDAKDGATSHPNYDALELFEIACHGGGDDENADAFTVAPDVVTYSLLYTHLLEKERGSIPLAASAAESLLQQAVAHSKKAAGSTRRRALAAARRRRSGTKTFREAESALRDLLGEDFGILEETPDLVVVNKPSGVVCFHQRATNAGKIGKKGKKNGDAADVSLEDALLSTGVPLSTLNAQARGLVHRLDRGTSGCLVLAKNDATHARLVADFFRRRVRKSYQCLVEAPSASSAAAAPHGRSTTSISPMPAPLTFPCTDDRRDRTTKWWNGTAVWESTGARRDSDGTQTSSACALCGGSGMAHCEGCTVRTRHQ